MAEGFLNQLLGTGNTVKVEELEDATCMVCLESYGTFNSSTGAVELQVRLPCKHLVGSMCIAKWLRDNNSCPACRATFFPAQPRPYFEHEIMNNRPSPNPQRLRGHDENDLINICHRLCHRLRMHRAVTEISRAIVNPLLELLPERRFPSVAIAATSIYFAWHLYNPSPDVANFFTDLSRHSQVGRDLVYSIYDLIYHRRMELIVPATLPNLVRHHMDGIFALLPRFNPASGSERRGHDEGRIDDETGQNTVNNMEARERSMNHNAESSRQIDEIVRRHGTDLGDAVYNLSEELYEVMYQHSILEDCDELVRSAVCHYIAYRLMGVEISYSDIACLCCINERLIRRAYHFAYWRRHELINPSMTEIMGNGNRERVLNAIPDLNWPPVQGFRWERPTAIED